MNLRAINEVTQPGVEAVSLADAKLFCSIDQTDEDALISAIISAARTTIEKQTGLVLVSHQFLLTMPAWLAGSWEDRQPGVLNPVNLTQPYNGLLTPRIGDGNRIFFERSPLVSIDSVQYYNTAEVQTPFVTTANWRTLTHCRPGALELRSDAQWPDVYDRSDAVQITFTAGHGPTAATVPADLVALMKLLIKHYYDNRDSFVMGGSVADVPFLIKQLIESNRVGGFVA